MSARGATGVAARTCAPHIARCLGKTASIVVTDMPGGNSVTGIAAAAASPEDGLMIKVLSGIALRQTTGFVESLLRLIGRTGQYLTSAHRRDSIRP